MPARTLIGAMLCALTMVMLLACSPLDSDSAPSELKEPCRGNLPRADGKDLLRYPPEVGDCYTVAGEVSQRLADEQFVVMTGDLFDFDNRVFVIGTDECLSGQDGRVLVDDQVQFTARYSEIYSTETVLGAPVEAPMVYCVPS